MKTSLRALLRGIIDYAGMFPPANLSLPDAINNFAQYQIQPEAWMLGRFICPAAKLQELEDFCTRLFSPAVRLPLSILGTGGKDALEFMNHLETDVQALHEFRARHKARTQTDVLEVRLPADVLAENSKTTFREFLNQIDNLLVEHQENALKLFVEISAGTDWHRQVPEALSALAEFNRIKRSGLQHSYRIGFKLRCGGLEPAAFPSIEQVALCLRQCYVQRVPFKATAGLHHPLRHFNKAMGTYMHGFINVFAAGVLAQDRELPEEKLQQILAEENPEHFHFEEDGLRWGEAHISPPQIDHLRQSEIISFGSCSFDEPREDLRHLGWLPDFAGSVLS